MSLRIYSSAFADGRIQARYGKASPDAVEGVPQLSFPVRWEGAP